MKIKTCKIFTDKKTVNLMLDKIDYKENLLNKKILENSCGTGNFLVEIVSRYIRDCQNKGFNAELIRRGLEYDICGIDKDEECLRQCRDNLDKIANEMGIDDINWQLILGDALQIDWNSVFDFVVGNPPYITYYNLPQEDRDYIRSEYAVCKSGKPDYYYAFIESSIRALKDGGKLIYLVPNNFMKNRFSDLLREYLKDHLTELMDFRNHKLFKGVLTSSAILVCEKNRQPNQLLYRDMTEDVTMHIDVDELQGKWAFYLDHTQDSENKFGDWFKVSAPIATLLNEVFILAGAQDVGEFIQVGEHKIERELVRRTESPKSKQEGSVRYIIFPYYYMNGLLMHYNEEQFRERFPEACRYLESYRNKLDKRKKDEKSQWYEYGRSQALKHINQEKILLSTLITDHVRQYRLDADTVPYSGMYLIPKEGHTLDEAEAILQSERFMEYVKEIGISVSGGSYRISPRDVNEYILPL